MTGAKAPMIDTRMLMLLSAALLVGACTTADRPAAAKASGVFATVPAGYIVDSILPIEEHLRRFREGLTQVDSLQGGADSERELVKAFLAAVSTQDSITLSHLLLSREEFAWLYYPAHAYGRPPYELDPGSFWTLIRGNSGKGFTRLLREYAGHGLGYVMHGCNPSDAVEAPVREWNQCEVGLTRDGRRSAKRMFGSIVAIGGRYKFVSYANDL
jgi:hypothetical protein